MLTPLVKRC